jgi:hypothetical protein
MNHHRRNQSQTHTAYLVMGIGQTVVWFSICSEPKPTVHPDIVTGVALEAEGSSYAEAKSTLVAEITKRWPWVIGYLELTLPGLDAPHQLEGA